jgi:hypothetical protein
MSRLESRASRARVRGWRRHTHFFERVRFGHRMAATTCVGVARDEGPSEITQIR